MVWFWALASDPAIVGRLGRRQATNATSDVTSITSAEESTTAETLTMATLSETTVAATTPLESVETPTTLSNFLASTETPSTLSTLVPPTSVEAPTSTILATSEPLEPPADTNDPVPLPLPTSTSEDIIVVPSSTVDPPAAAPAPSPASTTEAAQETTPEPAPGPAPTIAAIPPPGSTQEPAPPASSPSNVQTVSFQLATTETSLFAVEVASEAPITPVETTQTVAYTITSSTSAWPALMTIFKPPESCLGNVYRVSGQSVLTVAPTELPECYPESVYTTFSPGLCPSGYTVGLQEARHSIYQAALTTVTETAGYCCPSGFKYDSTACLHVVNAPVTLSGAAGAPERVTTPSNTFSLTLVSIIVNPTPDRITTHIVTNGVLYVTAPVFFVRFQDTDTALISTWSSIISSQNAELADILSSRNATINAGGGPAPGSSSGMQPAAIAGIAVGALVGLLVVIGLVIFILKRRKRQKRQNEETGMVDHHQIQGMGESVVWPKSPLSPVSPILTSPLPPELPAQAKKLWRRPLANELEASPRITSVELPADTPSFRILR